jgi:Ubiquitin 3 binding protein But2 C-terminal domain
MLIDEQFPINSYTNIIMFTKSSLLVLATLAASTLAKPVVRASTAPIWVEPAVMVQVSSLNPTYPAYNPVFAIENYSKTFGGTMYTLLKFAGIPSNANSCTLVAKFPAKYTITTGESTPNGTVLPVEVVSLAEDITDATTWATQPSVDNQVGLVNFQSELGHTTVINSIECSETLNFGFRLPSYVKADQGLAFAADNDIAADGGAGVFLTYKV